VISEKTRIEMREIMARYPQPRSALLPMLHLVQSEEGRVTSEGIEVCAEELALTPAEVSAVATFYTMYFRRPVGRYHVGVCTNTLCAVMGGDEIHERLKSHLDIGNDETTDDGQITLQHIECNAACDYAPVVMVNWEFVDNQTPESAVQLVDDLRSGKTVTSSRGATIGSWREAERVLAGFPDGRANEGPAAGPASLAGLELADREGWKAPTGTEDAHAERDVDRASTPGQAAEAPADTSRAKSESVQASVGSSTGSGSPDVRSDENDAHEHTDDDADTPDDNAANANADGAPAQGKDA
jgi:NADH-quinone oxidoreductase subunit E